MSSVVKTFRKSPIERKRLYLDYSCWLADAETLTDFQVFIAPVTSAAPIVVDSAYPDSVRKRLVTYVSGGVVNTDYVISMVVQTSDKQVKRDDIGLRVTV